VSTSTGISGCLQPGQAKVGPGPTPLGNTYKIAKEGRKVTRDSVDLLLPDGADQLSSMPPDTLNFPIRRYNSMCSGIDGSMLPPSKISNCGAGFHAVGELVAASDCSVQHPISNLKRVVAVCGDPIRAPLSLQTSASWRHPAALHSWSHDQLRQSKTSSHVHAEGPKPDPAAPQ
jgi:hypothetical protein